MEICLVGGEKVEKNHYLFLKFQNIEEVLYFIELY